MLKRGNSAHFELFLTQLSPLRYNAPSCTLRTHLRAVLWSHLELGEGCRLEDIWVFFLGVGARRGARLKSPRKGRFRKVWVMGG